MSFLLDTNVVSEWVKAAPNANVVAWLGAVDEESVFLSVMTLAELRRGVELLPVGRRRTRLERWVADDLTSRFEDRIVPVDRLVAEAWGLIMVRSLGAGHNLGVMDGFFAATAAAHQLTLVTRNTSHFERLGIQHLNPWEPN